mmetsp:Transcript_74212/g.131037  ORF Transcript_74212/g.131037 Transcript_74212/m.131037 type:complete len:144 (+) Transcript_74212:987-1418(+)
MDREQLKFFPPPALLACQLKKTIDPTWQAKETLARGKFCHLGNPETPSGEEKDTVLPCLLCFQSLSMLSASYTGGVADGRGKVTDAEAAVAAARRAGMWYLTCLGPNTTGTRSAQGSVVKRRFLSGGNFVTFFWDQSFALSPC